MTPTEEAEALLAPGQDVAISTPLPFRAEEVPAFAVLKGYFPTVRVSFARLVATIAERDALAARVQAMAAQLPIPGGE